VVAKTALEAVTEYLVTKQLGARTEVVRALYDYFVNNASPSDIAGRYGIGKHQVRGYVQRIMEKCDGNLARARAIIRRVAPLVLELEPVMVPANDGELYRCKICNQKVPAYVADKHVAYYHRPLIELYTDRIVSTIIEQVSSKHAKRAG